MFRSHAVTTPTRLMVLVLAAFLAFSPLAVMAAPAAQFGSNDEESGPAPLLLGEYASADLANGDSVGYEIAIPESGVYMITALDDAAAEDFDLVVTDEAGNELFNDVFATSEITLETGTVTLTFIAVTDQTLSFVMVGQIGGMSSDVNQPGKLIPGSVYINDEASDTLYATLSVPESSFPRQVLIAMETGDGDIFYAYAEDGDNVYVSTTTDTSNILRFWSQGGEYNIQVDPYERRSKLTLIVFLTGEPPALTMDEPVEGVVPATATEVVYELQLDTNYTNLELAVDGEDDLGITLLDNYYDYDVYYSSYGEEELVIDALYPGVYYVLVQSSEAQDEDNPFTLSITGEAGRPTAVLETGTAFDDEFSEGETSLNYSFDVVNPGALVTLSMSGDDPDTDFDLSAGLRPGGANWSSYNYGPDEEITLLAPIAGTYYVTVLSNDNTGAFTLQADEGDPAPTLETNTLLYDQIEGYSRNAYLLPIEEAGQLLSVILVGPEAVDLDLTVNGYNSKGDSIASLSGYSSGSAETVAYLLTEPGLYEVAVSSSYSEEGGYFFIQAQVVDPRFFGSQWATDATASSQYGEEDYSPLQATGANNTPNPGDFPTAWTSKDADGGVETLELTYDVPVKPSGIAIFESYNPGAITTIEAYDAENDEWVALYEGEAGLVEEASRVFIPDITPVDFVTDQIRLTLDTAAVTGWNEIDAVQLFGRP